MSNRYASELNGSQHGTMRRPEPTGAKQLAATRGPCNLDSRIRLLQSKLHPLSVEPMHHHFHIHQDEQDGEQRCANSSLKWTDNKSPSANRMSALNGGGCGQVEEEDEGDSLSLCSSLASSSSTSSSASSSTSSASSAPTPPPRLSSLRQSTSQQPYLSTAAALSQATANINNNNNIKNHLPIAHQVAVRGSSEQAFKRAQQSIDTTPAQSYTNQLVPTRTSPSKVNTNHQLTHQQHYQIPTSVPPFKGEPAREARGALPAFSSSTLVGASDTRSQPWMSANSRAPLTKAVQGLQQHQYLTKHPPPQSLHVVNVPASRRPITALWDKPPSRQLNSSSNELASNIHLISAAIQQRPHSALDSAKNNNNNHKKHSQPEDESCCSQDDDADELSVGPECPGEPLELVVDCEGGHLLLSGDSAHCIKFDSSDSEVPAQECGCAECWPQQSETPMLGWPEEEFEVEESSIGEELVPVVELRENPLCRLADLDRKLLDSTAAEQVRRSSRLLSEGQQERRAAVRLTADSSLQLLVAATSGSRTEASATKDAAASSQLLLTMQAAPRQHQDGRQGATCSSSKQQHCIAATSSSQPTKQNGGPSARLQPLWSLAGPPADVKASQRVSPTSSCSQAPRTQQQSTGEPAAGQQQQQQQQEQQQQQQSQHRRQTELLQLMRLRQVHRQQQPPAPSNAMKPATAVGSHELPTLEQLQQRLRCPAPHKSPSSPPQHEKPRLSPEPQQRPQHPQPPQQLQPRSQATQPIQEARLHLHEQLAASADTEGQWTDGAASGQAANLLTTATNTSPTKPTTTTTTAASTPTPTTSTTPTASERLQANQLCVHTRFFEGQQSAAKTQDMIPSAGRSTPANSVLSDSTTEAAMNSAQLIPKLIERLDRKLVVMKDEQLSLMREIELNECNGSRLFQSMESHLSPGELDKVSLHAAEIEKVTKLILSLKLRLKRLEAELEQRLHHSRRPLGNQPTNPQPHPDSSQHESSESRASEHQQQQQPKQLPSSGVARGISDPTSTGRLAKRNHQHHASLQPAGGPASGSTQHLLDSDAPTPAKAHPLLGPFEPDSGPTEDSGEPCLREEQEDTEDSQAANTAASSTSRDSIFNCDDSAIGSTITGHGGSASNIRHNHQLQATTCSQSSLSSSHCSSFNSSNSGPNNANTRHRLLRFEACASPSQSNLSSSISVSSHGSSVCSVPSSPPLVSPLGPSQPVDQQQCTTPAPHSSPSSSVNAKSLHFAAPNAAHLFKLPSSPHDSNNNNTANLIKPPNNQQQPEALLILTDLDILAAKRDKLISQLEEAHQLEECIAHRNNVIIQRILSKYYQPADNDQHTEPSEIEEFRQFTRLKSLLLKDMHDIAERIESAELQLTELKHTSQCSG